MLAQEMISVQVNTYPVPWAEYYHALQFITQEADTFLMRIQRHEIGETTILSHWPHPGETIAVGQQ